MELEQILKTREVQELFTALASLKSTDEAKRFMRDICTLSELVDMAERFQVAKLVDKGESYRSINEITGASTATITRVAHWLHHGLGGYALVLDRMK